MARRWIAAVFVLSLVVVVGWSQGAFAAARPANAGGGLELVGDGSRTVRFVAGEGRVTLVVRNVSAATGVLELDFIARGGERVTLTPRRPSGVQPRMSVLDPQDLRRPLARGGMRQVELRLGLPSDEAPQDGGGLLRARISSGSGTSVTVTLRGAAPDVVFDPPRLTIDVNQGCWGIATCGDTGIVVLRGRDAVAWARRTPRPRSTVILNNGDGGTVTVRLRHVVVQGGVVQATVDAGEPRDPGQYAGRLPIEPNGLAGPRLAVNVKIRWSIGVAVAVIFLGALFGGFFLRRFEIRRRRRLLELELLSALGRYDEERRLSGMRTTGYDLDDVLEPRRGDKAAATPYPGTHGVSALLWHIKTARDDIDFSEDIARTHALIAAIDRWLALEPVVRETARLLDGAAPPRRGRRELSDTSAFQDLEFLRMRSATAPASDRECEALLGALASQGRVAAKCKVMWELLSQLESRDGILLDQAVALAEHDVTAIEAQHPAFEDRGPEQTDQLLVALAHAEDQLRRMHDDIGGLDESPGLAEARRIQSRLDAPARPPAIEHGMPETSPWRLRIAGAFNALLLRSLVWTMARAVVAAVAYALVIYSDTWGSVTDFASAFTTGFLTETVVNWAVMPAFRTNRNRDAAATPQLVGGTAAAAEGAREPSAAEPGGVPADANGAAAQRPAVAGQLPPSHAGRTR